MSKEPAPKSALEDTTYYHFKSTPDELAQHYKPREIASGSTMEYTPRVNLNQVSSIIYKLYIYQSILSINLICNIYIYIYI